MVPYVSRYTAVNITPGSWNLYTENRISHTAFSLISISCIDHSGIGTLSLEAKNLQKIFMLLISISAISLTVVKRYVMLWCTTHHFFKKI